MSNHGYYLQLPGHLSRRGVIDVGLRCVHSCQFCFYRHPDDPKGAFDFMRHAEWRDTDQLVEQAKLMAGNGFLAADITGGEPSLHPGIVNLVRACSDASLAPRMISLAQFMDKRKNGETLLNHLLAAGMADFRISHHSHDPAIFKEITGGDLDKQLWAMRQLDEKGFEYTTNSTVVEGNYRTIPDLAREILTHNVYYSTLLFFMPHYDHALRVEERVRMRYSDAAKYVKEAADILEDGGVAVSVRYAPMCVMAGYEKNMVGMVGVRHDLHEWTNLVEHSGSGDAVRESRMIPMNPHEAPPGAWIIGETPQGPYLGRGSQQGVSKVFGKECQSCSALSVCDGVDKGYLDKHGETELTAYYFDQRGTVLDRDRLGYLAGHIAKLTPAGKPSVAVKRLLKPAPPAIETVSVVIANYNHGAEITKCIQSLSAQTWPGKLEIIVVDDGSTDGSHKLLSELAGVYENMTVDLYLEKSGGPARPRNIGLRKATGDLLAILDPDDWLEPTCIEEIVNALKKNPQASIVYFGLDTFGLNEGRSPAVPYSAEVETQQNFINCMSFYRRQVYEDVGGYDEAAILHGVEDWNFWVSAVRLGHIAVPIARQLAHYCVSETGLFQSEVLPNFEEKRNEVYRRNNEVYSVEFLDAHLKECGIVG